VIPTSYGCTPFVSVKYKVTCCHNGVLVKVGVWEGVRVGGWVEVGLGVMVRVRGEIVVGLDVNDGVGVCEGVCVYVGLSVGEGSRQIGAESECEAGSRVTPFWS
jgi:hypothetical protein